MQDGDGIRTSALYKALSGDDTDGNGSGVHRQRETISKKLYERKGRAKVASGIYNTIWHLYTVRQAD
jgi:hypothetical protein